MKNKVSVLFVCLGNICRSPTAHGVLRAKIHAAGLAGRIQVDSAGTGDWHLGAAPDRRARATTKFHGISIDDLRARQVTVADLATTDYVLAMDNENLADLQSLAIANELSTERISLFTDWCYEASRYPPGVPDPYAGGPEGFDQVFALVNDGTDALIKVLQSRLG